MMDLLASIAAGKHFPNGDESEDELRQLGYAASLARGRIEDPEDHITRVVKYCRSRVENLPIPAREYRDHVQEWWGASWHLDAQMLKKELHLHMKRIQKWD